MMAGQQYCLRWNNHQPNFISVFSSLLHNKTLVDVTLSAEGKHLQAHKLVLSACSSYFQTLFSINPCQHPIVILKDVKFIDLRVMVDFMYYGEVNVSQEQLPYILKTAEMLKIKGLAEMPVEPSVQKAQSNTSERTELLAPGDGNWNSENSQRQSLSPSPCPLSPSSRRKRLRKSSTGSGSGSAERASEDHQSSEVTLMSPSCGGGGGSSGLGTVIKPDPGGFTSDSSTTHRSKQHSSDSDVHRTSSHESVESDPPHQITLQIPQQDVNIQHTIDASSMEMPGPSVSSAQTITAIDRPISTTHAQFSQQQQNPPQVMGTKRNRFLMRQPRIKRESDTGQNPDEPLSPQYLSVPHLRIERQVSDPLPSASPPPSNLLNVPGGILVKQHSHPLLPSQTHQMQHSAPLVQILPHNQSRDDDRAVSPVVVVSDSMATSSFQEGSLRPDNQPMTATIRVRTDELRRSASSPQTGTRSSHCPVVRPGPALGCNYCWNTVDTHGRILRRKTKYHCPECQTNLCIVPCFQEYHERHMSTTQTDPIALTTSVMRIIPKNSSM